MKTIKKTKSILRRDFKLLKKVRKIRRSVANIIASRSSIPIIKQTILLKANTLKLMRKGIISSPKYKLLKVCSTLAPWPEYLKNKNSFSVFTGTFLHKCAKKDTLQLDPITALQYNHISDNWPFTNASQINCGSIIIPLAMSIEKPMSHHRSFLV